MDSGVNGSAIGPKLGQASCIKIPQPVVLQHQQFHSGEHDWYKVR